MKIFCEINLLKEPSLYQQQDLSKKWNNQARNADHYLWDGQSRAPLFLENVEANAVVAVDVWVEHLGAERDLKYVHVWMSEKNR